MNWQEFFNMGNHGLYVWWSYGATFVAIILLLLAFSWYKKKLLAKVKSHAKDKTPKARKVVTEQITE